MADDISFVHKESQAYEPICWDLENKPNESFVTAVDDADVTCPACQDLIRPRNMLKET